jgi:hypothetical protein
MRFIWGLLVGRDVRTGADLETGRGTHAVGQVSDQVADRDIAILEFAVQPAFVWSAAWHRKWLSLIVGSDAHHLVNVFCWTLTHCSSKGAMFSDCEHQCSQKVWGRAVGIGVQIWYACSSLLVVVFLRPKQWMRGCSLAGAADSAVLCGAPCKWFEACTGLLPCQAPVGPKIYTYHQSLLQSSMYMNNFPPIGAQRSFTSGNRSIYSHLPCGCIGLKEVTAHIRPCLHYDCRSVRRSIFFTIS